MVPSKVLAPGVGDLPRPASLPAPHSPQTAQRTAELASPASVTATERLRWDWDTDFKTLI